MSKSRVYSVWCEIIKRCESESSSRFEYYGARGVTVDPQWRDFNAFYLDMGDPPSDKHEIDRKENDKGYYKGNCRWATMTLRTALEDCYSAMEGSDEAQRYSALHGIDSLAILTVYDDETAQLVASHLERRVRHKTVIEIGGGFGLLALHLSEYAKHIYVIEANPVWTSVYVAFLHRHKPPNVTFIFGSAEEMAGRLKGDLAIFCTHSDASGMRQAGLSLAPECIDVYGEILESMSAPDSSLIFETMLEIRKGVPA